MNVGSLFSGIGGFDLGLERAGLEIEWQVENNDYCRRVLQKHWPAVPCHYDIKSIDWNYIPRVDLVCGGFPCQPFSCAGKRQGKDDDRYLWPEVVRCLAVLRPTWGLFENVFNLLNMGIEQVCADLEALGYQVAVLGIPACAVDAPHIRKRLWILAYTENDLRRASRHDGPFPLNGSGASVADAECGRRWESSEPVDAEGQPLCEAERIEGSSLAGSGSAVIPDSTKLRRREGHSDSGRSGQGTRETKERAGLANGSWWPIEPAVGRVADGVPARVDRLKGLGNAIVPQIAEALGRMILEVEQLAG